MPPKKTRSSIASSFQPAGKRSTSGTAPVSAKGKAALKSATSASTKAKPASPTEEKTKEEQALDLAQKAALANFPDAEPLSVDDSRYDGYWKIARRKMGQPVHAQGLNRIHHMLRVFDMDPTFGPCMGLTRLERWYRARDDFEEQPPEAVRLILLTKEGQALDEYRLPVYSSTFGGWGL
ncbi:hypothetical protein OC846_005793 [Tilletia horrida]|uniref:DNA polymerase delta subunit 4 n=1 Tax=Tilletia horrida TaxID=155126 RepID=A0AAN6GPW2_9BASI|nr:hypothetical protein OC846_005793 [Tilletia horrida]KAK0553260.1 hypothetical protein OC845_001260 [Tilletia horrida]KAK0570259.1 hypothetical protein OC861_000002 [Tilletia horrida]